MRAWAFLLPVLVVGMALADAPKGERHATQAEAVRFEAVDVYVDAGDAPLAAYQVVLSDRSGRAEIVGIEGGEPAAYSHPPYYDPAALMKRRVVLAAFSMARDLPLGRTRVARLHVQVVGEGRPDFEINLRVAADRDGAKVPATASLSEGEG